MGAGGEAYKAKKEWQSQLRKAKSRVTAVEKELEQVDEELAESNNALSDPQVAADYQKAVELTERIDLLTKRQEELLDEWARLSEMLEEMEAQS